MGTVTLTDIELTPLVRVPVIGGDVLHALKATDPGFVGFGEAYFSFIEPDAVKAWKRHTQMTLNLVVPVGLVKFVFCDDSGTFLEKVIGETNYSRLTVPPGLWFGFQGMYSTSSLVLNLADIAHDPSEVERKAPSEFQYIWGSCL